MNIKKIAVLLLSLSVVAFAGKVITYTASSVVSQEEANNTAIAGVAKQVSSTVKADDRLQTTDVTANGKETISETYTTSKNVKTNVDLKWIKVTPLPKEGKKFRATATLDVDEMTNNIRLQMATAKEKLERFEAAGRAALDASRYDEAVRNLAAAESLLQPYAQLKAELAKVFTLNDSYNLKHDLPGLKAAIASRLANIQVEAVPALPVIDKDIIADLNVTVTDANGIVTDFPLKAVQNGKVLAERRTQDQGVALFTIQNVEFGSGKHAISLVPNFPKDILKAAGMTQGFVVQYEVKMPACNVRLDCKGSADGCKALTDQMAKQSIFVGNDAGFPLLNAEVKSTPKSSLNQLLSFDVAVSVSGDRVSFSKTSKGVGKTEGEAVSKAIGKLKFKELEQQVKATCAK
jgi:hypothetical protein